MFTRTKLGIIILSYCALILLAFYPLNVECKAKDETYL